MPSSRQAKPLYQRGPYRLVRRAGRTNLEIVWYDTASKRERSRSAGSREMGQAKDALDRFYLSREKGQSVCQTCGRPWEDNRRFLLTQSMLDYDAARQSRTSYEAIHARLGHVHAYLTATGQTSIACEDLDEEWIDAFTEWAMDIPVQLPNGSTRQRAAGTVNASVAVLAAAVNFSHKRRDTLFAAAFRAKQPAEVNRTPTYRSDVAELARMFAYALQHPVKRRALLNFLRISVATLVRPEHAHYVDVDAGAGMWHRADAVMNLLPRNQAQTKKRRAMVPMARQAVEWLNGESGQIVPVNSIVSAWNGMRDEIGLAADGQAGPKLIRRSMAKLVRDRIDRRDTPELEMFLGHRTIASTTDLYAPFDPEYLARVRAAIESIIDDIERDVPDAYRSNHTADLGAVISIKARKTQ